MANIEQRRVKKPVSYGGNMYDRGDTIRVNKQHAKEMEEKGILHPAYETKEDKNAYSKQVKAYKKHLGGGWYEIRRAGTQLEKLQGKQKAEARVEELNDDG